MFNLFPLYIKLSMDHKFLILVFLLSLAMSTPKLKTGTLNTAGLRSVDSNKRTATLQWIKENKFDVMFLQETHAETDCFEYLCS
jgi:hypothetical protein